MSEFGIAFSFGNRPFFGSGLKRRSETEPAENGSQKKLQKHIDTMSECLYIERADTVSE
jgi:hypothetical protein